MRWAVVTPSYSLDLERCQLLCRSMDAFLAGPWHHYIIVDPVDLPLFLPLAGPRRTIINKKDVLPKGFHFGGKIPLIRLGRWWWSLRHGPVFGWQMQQYVKMLMAGLLEEEAMAFFDSDVFFLRPFDIGTFAKGHKVRFNPSVHVFLWENADVASSMRIVGVEPTPDKTAFWGQEQIVTWHRQTVLDMLDYITKLQGKPWHEAIGRKLNFAEYHLYGTYVLYVQKNNPHLFDDELLYCKSLWTRDQAVGVDVREFCLTLAPHQSAVCIQSSLGADIATITSIVDEAIAAK
nr:DUF6492 family protein [Aestuariivirga litoralis]